jgi:hypothetical protein
MLIKAKCQVKWRHNRTNELDGETSLTEAGTLSLLRLVGEEGEAGRYDCMASTRLDTVNSRPAFVKIQGKKLKQKKQKEFFFHYIERFFQTFNGELLKKQNTTILFHFF